MRRPGACMQRSRLGALQNCSAGPVLLKTFSHAGAKRRAADSVR